MDHTSMTRQTTGALLSEIWEDFIHVIYQLPVDRTCTRQLVAEAVSSIQMLIILKVNADCGATSLLVGYQLSPQ